MLEAFVPLGIAFLGLIGMVVYVLAVALSKMSQRVLDMNERLMVLAGFKLGGEPAARALVASAKQPKRSPPKSPAKPVEKSKPKEAYRITVGGS